MASIPLAVVCGLAAAAAFGVSTAVQHDVAHTAASGGGLLTLVRRPRWWASVLGDSLGLVLQLVALVFGPVVIVQPLFVLCLPVALLCRPRLGGPRPTRTEYGLCVLLAAGLAGFFALAGDPGEGRLLSTRGVLTVAIVALVVGAVAWPGLRQLRVVPRVVAISALSGAWLGVEAVLFNAAARRGDGPDGLHGVLHPAGLLALVGAAVLGLLGFALTQIAFGLGELAAGLPANLIADPVVAVVLGAAVLGQRLPLGPVHVLGYLVCLAAVGAAVVRLARPPLEASGRLDGS